MFGDSTAFNRDIGMWDTSSVSDMQSMFAGASSFSADLSTWNVEKLRTANAMFQGASRFNSNLCSWNVTNIADSIQMFSSATSYNQSLCSWGDRLVGESSSKMFDTSGCANSADPDFSSTPVSPLCIDCTSEADCPIVASTRSPTPRPESCPPLDQNFVRISFPVAPTPASAPSAPSPVIAPISGVLPVSPVPPTVPTPVGSGSARVGKLFVVWSLIAGAALF